MYKKYILLKYNIYSYNHNCKYATNAMKLTIYFNNNN